VHVTLAKHCLKKLFTAVKVPHSHAGSMITSLFQFGNQ